MNEKINNKDNGNFVGVDLHIHTPAFTCYKGPENEEEYINILRRYVDLGIKVIAITDHNTIKGYQKLISIKQELESKISLLNEFIKNHPSLEGELNCLNQNLELFAKIIILPGIELETKPGIHMLLIFDPSTNVSLIENFLEKAGYSKEVQGLENPGIVAKWDVLDTLKEASNLDAIIIASHADSNKGIYNDLKGSYRAQVFSSSQLMGISYNSPKAYKKMEGLYQQKEYKRQTPIAFIQCSDYHGGDDNPASSITYLKMEDLSYSEVCNALQNPTECVSATMTPKMKDILQKIAIDPTTKIFETFSEDVLPQIKQAACATLNNGYGGILIGVNPNDPKNILGVHVPREEVLKKIKEICKELRPKNPAFVAKWTSFDYGGREVVFLKLVSKRRSIFSLNDEKVYISDDNGSIKEAKPIDIAEATENLLLRRMASFNEVNKSRIDAIINEVEFMRDTNQQFSLINKIERTSFMLNDIINVEIVECYSEELKITSDLLNGDSTGNVVIIDSIEPRLPYAYLRCSAPRSSSMTLESLPWKKFEENAIIIAPGGGVYIMESDSPWTIISKQPSSPVLVLRLKDKYKSRYSEKAIVAWLKSSLFLWYCYTSLGDIDIHNPRIFSKIPLPELDILKPNGEVDIIIGKMQDLEFSLLNFLKEQKLGNDENDEVFHNAVNDHNKVIDIYAVQIDQMINSVMRLNDKDIIFLKSLFDLKKIYYSPNTFNLESLELQKENIAIV